MGRGSCLHAGEKFCVDVEILDRFDNVVDESNRHIAMYYKFDFKKVSIGGGGAAGKPSPGLIKPGGGGGKLELPGKFKFPRPMPRPAPPKPGKPFMLLTRMRGSFAPSIPRALPRPRIFGGR